MTVLASSPAATEIRWIAPLSELGPADLRALFDRTTSGNDAVRTRTAAIVAAVRNDGDAALRALGVELDDVRLEELEVPRQTWSRALDALDPMLRASMERAADNIARVHRAFVPVVQEVESEPGVVIVRRPDPLRRVGVYAPGGRAVYPSSLLMGAVPARVAGVREVIVCSPPRRDTGEPASAVLAAAALANVDRLFAIGGAGAIAALAYGTDSVPRVDRIVGPGNAYVAEAKIQVSSAVAIDSPAGPSELLVLCDDSADPDRVASEMLAQAEHDPLAAVVALSLSAQTARRIVDALGRRVADEPRAEIVRSAFASRGAVLWTESLDEAIAFTNQYAAEHLQIVLRGDVAALERIRNAGTVFVGASASVAFGDYMTGANHVLPTGGLARSYSGLSTLDFFRWTTCQRVSPEAAARMAGAVAVFAEAEGLPAHAAAARGWDRGGSA